MASKYIPRWLRENWIEHDPDNDPALHADDSLKRATAKLGAFMARPEKPEQPR